MDNQMKHSQVSKNVTNDEDFKNSIMNKGDLILDLKSNSFELQKNDSNKIIKVNFNFLI